MERLPGPCHHSWRYLVDLRTRAIRIRECEKCGRRSVVPVELAPLPTSPRLQDTA